VKPDHALMCWCLDWLQARACDYTKAQCAADTTTCRSRRVRVRSASGRRSPGVTGGLAPQRSVGVGLELAGTLLGTSLGALRWRGGVEDTRVQRAAGASEHEAARLPAGCLQLRVCEADHVAAAAVVLELVARAAGSRRHCHAQVVQVHLA